jgi:hypothetical protein
MESLKNLFDGYSWNARVFPAILTLVPVLPFVLVAAPKLLLGEFPKNALVAIMLFAVLYLLAGAARSAGKRAEERLVACWGGRPTTLMLRHTDARVDRVTKSRYHRILAKMCPDIVWPTAQDEAEDQSGADVRYDSAVAVLRARRRRVVDVLVLRENASYGFRRNMLGLRPVAIVISLACALCAGTLLYLAQFHEQPLAAAIAKVGADPRYAALLVAELGIAVGWTIFVRRVWVRQAADDYAVALLGSLDGTPAEPVGN